VGIAQDERRQLVELMAELGPDAPTLCGSWRTRDLAAHLVIRERRPDTAPGIMLKPFVGHTRRVQDSYAAKAWSELLELVRTGPPFWVAPVDELINTAEYFVHHEDVRRAQDDWEPRPPDARRDRALWRFLPFTARVTYGASPVGVVLRRPDGERLVAKRGANGVVLTGEVSELVMHAFGRDQARVEFTGDAQAVSAVQALNRSL
jgi:uncharacterized protein (TIGR03085 family)